MMVLRAYTATVGMHSLPLLLLLTATTTSGTTPGLPDGTGNTKFIQASLSIADTGTTKPILSPGRLFGEIHSAPRSD